MSTTSDLLKVRTNYAGLPENLRPENPSGQCIFREYSFLEAAKFDAYKVPSRNANEIVAVFNAFTNKDATAITEKDFFEIVSVALNVLHPVTKARIFKDPYTANDLCPTFSSAVPAETSKVSLSRESSSHTIISAVPAAVGSGPNSQTVDEAIELQATAISFLFSWITRFAVKAPTAALDKQYESLESTYTKFYQHSSKVFSMFKPDITLMQCIRNAFDAFTRVKNTLVLYVAAAETYLKSDPRAFNVARYLYFQNLEFMGMHAYVSIVNITAKVSLKPALILTWLRISGAELAVDEAHIIMTKHDNGMINNGMMAERLWKYARILDPGYFNRLQTSYAAELISMLAHIEIKLGISQETGYSSPLRIYVIANNRHVREIGAAKADAFMECLSSVIAVSEEASVVDKVYARKRKTQGAEQYEQDDVEYVPMEVDLGAEAKRKRPEETKKVLPAKKKLPTIPKPPVLMDTN